MISGKAFKEQTQQFSFWIESEMVIVDDNNNNNNNNNSNDRLFNLFAV